MMSPDKLSLVSLLVAAISGGGLVVTSDNLDTQIARNDERIESVEKVHEIEMGYIKKELSEIKQLIKDG